MSSPADSDNPAKQEITEARPATPADAAAMCDLVDMAGEGLAVYSWSMLAKSGQSPREVGLERARRDTGAFSWRNTTVLERDGQVAAVLIGYPLADEPEATDYSGMPAIFVPLQQLEDLVPGTWYLNVLATYPAFRRQGMAGRLLELAETRMRETGKRGISLIVADSNLAARSLYASAGYEEVARRPMVKEGWDGPGSEWVLLRKPAS